MEDLKKLGDLLKVGEPEGPTALYHPNLLTQLSFRRAGDYESLAKKLAEDFQFQNWKHLILQKSEAYQSMTSFTAPPISLGLLYSLMIITPTGELPFDVYLYECREGIREDVHELLGKTK